MIPSMRAAVTLVAAAAAIAIGAGSGNAAVGNAITQGRAGRAAKRLIGTTAKAGAPALVSRYGPRRGRYVARPSRLNLIYGYRSDVAADHLRWVDWGQPVAFATGDILIQGPSGGFQSVNGALVLNGLVACGPKPTYYYTSATAFTPTYDKYTEVSTGRPLLASPC